MKRFGMMRVFLLGLLVWGSACQCSQKADLTNLTTMWTSLEEGFTGKLGDAKAKYDSVYSQFKSLKVDAEDAFANAEHKKLEALLQERKRALSELSSLFKKHKDTLEATIRSANVVGFKHALSTAKTDLEAATAKITEIESKNKVIESVLARVVALVNFDAANKRENPEMEAGATVSFNDIDFVVGKAEFDFSRPESKAALEKLKVFLNVCPELQVNIYGHSSKEGDAEENLKLSDARAVAVQKYLVSQKVSKEKIVETEGKGSTEQAIPEPEPESAAANGMDATTLEGIRRVNRRISVQVIEPCKAAAVGKA